MGGVPRPSSIHSLKYRQDFRCIYFSNGPLAEPRESVILQAGLGFLILLRLYRLSTLIEPCPSHCLKGIGRGQLFGPLISLLLLSGVNATSQQLTGLLAPLTSVRQANGRINAQGQCLALPAIAVVH